MPNNASVTPLSASEDTIAKDKRSRRGGNRERERLAIELGFQCQARSQLG
jgi:hypothetical protein